MCGRQEGSVHYHIRDRHAVTHTHTPVTFKEIYASLSGLGDTACYGGPPAEAGDDPTGQCHINDEHRCRVEP